MQFFETTNFSKYELDRVEGPSSQLTIKVNDTNLPTISPLGNVIRGDFILMLRNVVYEKFKTFTFLCFKKCHKLNSYWVSGVNYLVERIENLWTRCGCRNNTGKLLER